GGRLTRQKGGMRIQVCSGSSLRVRYLPAGSVPGHPDLIVIKKNWPATPWEMRSSDEGVVLSTAQVKAVIARKNSSITFQDFTGKTLFQQTEEIGRASCRVRGLSWEASVYLRIKQDKFRG